MPTDGPPTMETSFQSTGESYGVGYTNIGTYTATMRQGGRLYGEGQGVIMTADGGGGTWKGTGLGQFGPGGSVSYRGALYIQTDASGLERLNEVAVAFEYEVDAEGSVRGAFWEWK